MSATLWRPPVRDAEQNEAHAAGKQLTWMRGGAKHKLLWMSVDRADVPLVAALSAWGIEADSPGPFGRP